MALDAENIPPLSDAEYSKVRAFGLDRKPRFDDVEGIRFGFVILGGMALFLLAVGVGAVALVAWLVHP